jgi:phenylacetate-CoA ligase
MSGGTLRTPKLIAYTTGDWRESVLTTADALHALGVTRRDTLAILYPFGAWSIGMIFAEAARQLRVTTIPLGISLPYEYLRNVLATLKPTVIAGAPAQVCGFATKLGQPLHPIRLVIAAGERITKNHRQLIYERWHAQVRGIYGCAELDTIGVECLSTTGYHVPSHRFALEIRGRGRIRPHQPARRGELLLTPLRRQATTLVRYSPGDLVSAIWRICRCGSGEPLVNVLHRSDGSVTLRDGTLISPTQIDNAIASSGAKVTAHQLIVSRLPDHDHLELRIVPGDDELTQHVAAAVQHALRLASIDLADAIAAGIVLEPLVTASSLSQLAMTARGKTIPIVERTS